MSEETTITWVDDYCFDCQVACKSTDKEHETHKRLFSKAQPVEASSALGINVSDGLNTKERLG